MSSEAYAPTDTEPDAAAPLPPAPPSPPPPPAPAVASPRQRLLVCSVDPKLRATPAHLVAVLSNEVPPDANGYMTQEDGLACLWSLATNPAQRDAILKAAAIPVLVSLVKKGAPGARLVARDDGPSCAASVCRGASPAQHNVTVSCAGSSPRQTRQVCAASVQSSSARACVCCPSSPPPGPAARRAATRWSPAACFARCPLR